MYVEKSINKMLYLKLYSKNYNFKFSIQLKDKLKFVSIQAIKHKRVNLNKARSKISSILLNKGWT
jgi:hypothetical protein